MEAVRLLAARPEVRPLLAADCLVLTIVFVILFLLISAPGYRR